MARTSVPAVSIAITTGTNNPPQGGDVTFTATVDVEGTDPHTGRWFKNGTVISGETADTLALTGVTSTDDGDYSFEARFSTPTVNILSNTIRLTAVNEAPTVSIALTSGELRPICWR